MAVPVSVSLGPHATPGSQGPFKSSAGDYYGFLHQAGGESTTNAITKIQVLKSSNPTSSWSELTAQAWTPYTGDAHIRWSCDQVGDTVHVVVILSFGATPGSVKYRQFDMSTDTWGTEETVYTDVTSARRLAGVHVRSSGEVVAVFSGATQKVGGTDFDRVYYSRRTGVNTWTAAAQADMGGSVHYTLSAITGDSADRVHIGINEKDTANPPDLWIRTLSASNTLNTPTSFDTSVTGVGHAIHEGVAYDDGGTERVRFVYWNNTSPVQGWVAKFDAADNPTVTTERMSDTFAVSPRIDAYNADLHVAFLRSGDFYHDENTGAGWGTDTLVRTYANDADALKGRIFQRGSEIVYGVFIWEENPSGGADAHYYDEYVIVAAPARPPWQIGVVGWQS